MSKRKQRQFLQLYEPVHDQFERFCRARAFADMPYEDLVNETLLVAYRRLPSLKKTSSFLSFLIGISLKILANARRKKREVLSHDYEIDQYPEANKEIDRKYEIQFLHFALSKLPEEQREAIILFEITGFKIKEIMQLQNCSESAVKQRLFRGRKMLALIVEKEMRAPKSQS